MSVKRAGFVSAAIIALGWGISETRASIIYDNTTSPAGIVWEFEGAKQVGSNLVANVDLNQLILAPGSAGMEVTFVSVRAHFSSADTAMARPTIYLWAANGIGGNPGTLLDVFVLPVTTFVGGGGTNLAVTLPSNSLLVPTNEQIWAGLGFDNDNGTTGISVTDLNGLGALAHHPATVGIDGQQAYFLSPHSPIVVDNPPIIPAGFGTFDINFGWMIQASPLTVPEPDSFTMLMIGASCLVIVHIHRHRRAIYVRD